MKLSTLHIIILVLTTSFFLGSLGFYWKKISTPPAIQGAANSSVSSSSESSSSSSSSSSSASSTPAPKPVYEIKPQIKMPILMYHHIDTTAAIPASDAVGIGLRVSPSVFDRQLQYIQDQGYTTVTSFDLADYLNGDKDLPAKPIMLTFDYGYKDNIIHAVPLLEKRGMKGDFAIITSVLGTGEYMNWDDLKVMKQKGMGIASHTTNHCPLALKNTNAATKVSKPYLDSPIGDETTPCPNFGYTGQLTTGQIYTDLI